MPSNDIEYFRDRALEERQRAAAAVSAAIRTVHLEFAVRYEQLAGELRTALEMRSSRQAVHRSMELLKTTDGLVSDVGNYSQGEKQAPA